MCPLIGSELLNDKPAHNKLYKGLYHQQNSQKSNPVASIFVPPIRCDQEKHPQKSESSR